MYQVYPRSFVDSDGDGVGDLAGVRSRLPYLRDLGVDAVWLSPFYRSPQRDGGYDVADYRDVDAQFGSLDDAIALIDATHDVGLRFVLDIVPNHTSSQHRWFQEALTAPPGGPARDRYIFRDGAGPDGSLPPNDWTSEFGGPAWTRVLDDDRPGQWYLHLFNETQPDLNWHNREVREEFLAILRFWADRGVDGFRIDVAHGLVKADGLPSWPYRRDRLAGPDTVGKPPAPFFDQEPVVEIYEEWRQLLDSYDDPRMMVAEAYVGPPARLARYVAPGRMHQAFNFEFMLSPFDGPTFRRVIDATLAAMGEVHASSTWVLSNHDVMRDATRYGLPADYPFERGVAPGADLDVALGLRRARAAALLVLALPGSAYVYQGEELGLPEVTDLPPEQRQDPAFGRDGHSAGMRDGCRVPLPWTSGRPAYGFSPSGRSWLDQPASWQQYAVDVQSADPGSTLSLYRDALALRRRHELGAGRLEWLEVHGGPADVLTFANGDLHVLLNGSPSAVAVPGGWEVVLRSDAASSTEAIPPDTTVWAVRA